MRSSVLLLVLAGLHAPMQCGSKPEPALATEESPGEALYTLAERFRAQGDEQAWRTTLEHLVARYPSSRFAVRARLDLEDGFSAARASDAADGG